MTTDASKSSFVERLLDERAHLLHRQVEIAAQARELRAQLEYIEQNEAEIADDLIDIKAMLERRGHYEEDEESPNDEADTAEAETDAAAPDGTTTRDAILAMLNSEDRMFRTDEIAKGAPRFGTIATEGTIRSYLVRLFNTGQIDKPHRGFYRAWRNGDAASSAANATQPVLPEDMPDSSFVSYDSSPTTTRVTAE